jgi:hypothetical protein
VPVPSSKQAWLRWPVSGEWGSGRGGLESWQAFAPSGGGPGQEPGPAGEVGAGGEERARTLSLIDFLADYDARRNPPAYDIGTYGLFFLRDSDLPRVPGVSLSPAAEAWLAVDFLDLPQRPEVPEELAEVLRDSAAISPHVRPEVRAVPVGTEPGESEPDPDPGLVAAVEQWIAGVWELLGAPTGAPVHRG